MWTVLNFHFWTEDPSPYTPIGANLMEKPITKVAEHTWMITDYYLDNYYVVEGESFAALIDTGIGMGNMLGDVRKLTDKPLKVLLTHGHPDHCGGVYAFDTVPYMSPVDEDIARIFYDEFPQYRKNYVGTRGPLRLPKQDRDKIQELLDGVPNETEKFTFAPLMEGDIYDLGNRPIETISTPGHSSGSVSFLDKKQRILFSGDIVGDSVLLFGRSTVEEEQQIHKNLFHDSPAGEIAPDDHNVDCLQRFLAGLEKMWSRREEFDHLAVGHGQPLREKTMILDFIHMAEKLLNHDVKGTYEETSIRKGWVYKENGLELWYKCEK
jgi:glyoxylase-like metal-dependent hydrolase (beta-lactamase superfamily II)